MRVRCRTARRSSRRVPDADRGAGCGPTGHLEEAVAADPDVDVAEPPDALRGKLPRVGLLDEQVCVAECVPLLEPHPGRGYPRARETMSSAISSGGLAASTWTRSGIRRIHFRWYAAYRRVRTTMRSSAVGPPASRSLRDRGPSRQCATRAGRDRRAHLLDDALREHRLRALPDPPLEESRARRRGPRRASAVAWRPPEPVSAGHERLARFRELERADETLAIVRMDSLRGDGIEVGESRDVPRRGRRRPRWRSGLGARARPPAARRCRQGPPGDRDRFRQTRPPCLVRRRARRSLGVRAPRTRRRSSSPRASRSPRGASGGSAGSSGSASRGRPASRPPTRLPSRAGRLPTRQQRSSPTPSARSPRRPRYACRDSRCHGVTRATWRRRCDASGRRADATDWAIPCRLARQTPRSAVGTGSTGHVRSSPSPGPPASSPHFEPSAETRTCP